MLDLADDTAAAVQALTQLHQSHLQQTDATSAPLRPHSCSPVHPPLDPIAHPHSSLSMSSAYAYPHASTFLSPPPPPPPPISPPSALAHIQLEMEIRHTAELQQQHYLHHQQWQSLHLQQQQQLLQAEAAQAMHASSCATPTTITEWHMQPHQHPQLGVYPDHYPGHYYQTSYDLHSVYAAFAASAAAARIMETRGSASCHQCKTSKVDRSVLFCTNHPDSMREDVRPEQSPPPPEQMMQVQKRRCRKKFCNSCLRRYYDQHILDIQQNPTRIAAWVCPACEDRCACRSCVRKNRKLKASSSPPLSRNDDDVTSRAESSRTESMHSATP